MGYEKRNKRHAQKSMRRKRKNWTHEGPRKKKRKEIKKER
jgi:hypothetical protein